MNSSLSRCLLLAIIASVSLSCVFAAGPTIYTTPPVPGYTRLCSVASRGTSIQTIESLYALSSFQKAYITKVSPSVNFTAIITGASSRHHNKQGIASNPNCNLTATIGAREANEIAQWGQFWSKNTQSYRSLFNTDPSYNTNEISTIQAANLQSYIDRSCGFDLKEDGKIGVKTLNAPFVCMPPCDGKCGWQTFASLKDNLYYDEEGTKKVHDGSVFTDEGNPSSVMYIDGSKLTTIPDGLQDYLILSGGHAVAKDTGSVAKMLEERGLGLVKKNTVCSLNIRQITTLNAITLSNELPTRPIVISDGLDCFLNDQKNNDGSSMPIDKVKSSIKEANMKIQNTDITDDQINKLGAKPAGSDGGGDCALKDGDGVVDTPGVCACKPNYKRTRNPLGEETCEVCDPVKCNCGTKLNTNVPRVGRCIRYDSTNDVGDPSVIGTDAGADQTIVVNQLNAFPVLVSGLIKILMVLLGLLNFANLIIGGVQMTIPESYADGRKRVQGVGIGLAVFGALGVVLYLTNPNFFT